MFKRILIKTGVVMGMFLCLWIIMAQSCMKFRMSDEKAIKEFAAANVVLTPNTIKVNGRNLHYVKAGSDTLPTIIFVHGSPGSWDAFAAYLKDKDLLKKFRMVSIDRPGFGYSNFGDALHLEDESVIISPLFYEIQNHQPMYLVGHSLGGPMIVELAADNPGMFSGLVILSGALDSKEEDPEKWRLLFMNNPLKFLVPGAMRPSNYELWYLKKDLVLLKPKYAMVKCPVTIIHGDKDRFVSYGNLAFAGKAFINSVKVDTITLPGANHFIPWTRYARIKTVLMDLH